MRKKTGATDVLRELLLEYLKDTGETRRGLSLKAGFNETLVRDIITGKSKRVALDTYKRLIAVMEMDHPGWMARHGALSPIDTMIDVPCLNQGRTIQLARTVLTRDIPPERLVAYAVTGPSMSPTLTEGDLAIADTGDTGIAEGAIFLVRSGSRTTVARLRYAAGQAGQVQMLYDNPVMPPDTVPEPELEVIGRVRVMIRTPV